MELLKKEKFNAVPGKTYYCLVFANDYNEYTIEEYVAKEDEQLLKCFYFEKKEDITAAVADKLKKELIELEGALSTIFRLFGKKAKVVEETTVKVLDKVEKDMVVFSQKYEDQTRN